VFAALGDRTRLRLVSRLSGGDALSIARLTRGSRMSRQAVTKHLRTLARAGLVRSARCGRERLWELETGQLAQAALALERVSRQWDAAIERLRRLVE
jgi:DNA-binding transcriptional ArsR family regulator